MNLQEMYKNKNVKINDISKGEKYIYADCLWGDTPLDVNELHAFFKDNRDVEPSDISSLEKTEEYQQNNLFWFKSMGKIEFKKTIDETNWINIKSLYWN